MNHDDQLIPAEMAAKGDALLRKGVSTQPGVLYLSATASLAALYMQHRGIVREIGEQIQMAIQCGCPECQKQAPDLIQKHLGWTQDLERLAIVTKLLEGLSCDYPLPSQEHCEGWLEQARSDRVANQLRKVLGQ